MNYADTQARWMAGPISTWPYCEHCHENLSLLHPAANIWKHINATCNSEARAQARIDESDRRYDTEPIWLGEKPGIFLTGRDLLYFFCKVLCAATVLGVFLWGVSRFYR